MDLLGVDDVDDDIGQMKGIMRYGKGGSGFVYSGAKWSATLALMEPRPGADTTETRICLQSGIVLVNKNISCCLFCKRGYFECLAVAKSGSSGCRY